MSRLLLFVMIISCVVAIATSEKIGENNEVVNVSLNADNDYRISYRDISEEMNPFKVEVWSEDATSRYPILVVVKQERRVTSWEIPLPVKTNFGTSLYSNTSRILCYDSQTVIDRQLQQKDHGAKRSFLGRKPRRNFTVTLSTASPTPVNVHLRAAPYNRYFIRSNVYYETRFSPSEPAVHLYEFPPNVLRDDEIRTVLIDVSSDDDVCFTVSAQPKICPVYDLNDDIVYDGKYQTVSTRGGLTIQKSAFPEGFYLVFVSKGDNYDCNHGGSLPQPKDRPVTENKQASLATFRVQIGKTRTEYVGAVLVVFFSVLVVCILLVIITVAFFYLGKHQNIERYKEPRRPEIVLPEDVTDSYHAKTEPKVIDFIYKGSELNRKKSLNYSWHILNIAIFYGIPVVQLMISYQRAVNYSGNLDLCYHNFQCSHPLYFTDFNHIFSNIGYILFGLLFLGMTFFRSRKYRNKPECGIPKLFGLYYSMGLALIFEGVLSACYHICPNQSNFQFDTSFMYVMAALIMVKLYQNRHPDVNASAYSTFAVLGFAVVLAMFGILFNSMAIMVIFIVAYIAFCIYVALKIYFFSYVVKGMRHIYSEYRNDRRVPSALKPIRIGRFITVTVANVINFLVAIAGLALYPKVVDFGTFLLGILMLNAIVYAIFYCVMKLIYRERICFEAIFYGLLAAVSWGFGCYFFLNASTVWSATPAESRQLNQPCILMGFYDTHDVWHLLSAPALYFSFMFLMVLDDDLYDKPQNNINAF
ncbi:PREDICTED: SID1 transmembrane family member 1-like [Nicrophorus vespilloides]|uniref:SID1 transmembrane family member 1-like n=1 Tax=Nicrophorus vespilloides TaxID=110193 RepID=A0ABM1M4D7_NICVS|nr:PREDICTED: SID1 transmembrane family member 1-like [Nicrophorus vespilloides]